MIWTHCFMEPGKKGLKRVFLTFITSYTISLMEEFKKRDKPFFMHHNFWGPHQPYFVPEEYLRLYDDIDIPEWESF